MAVKLTVLSGSMQGHVLETGKNVIHVGANISSEIAFDVLSDPEVEGQQVRFELLDDRWRLFNSSTQPLFVNQDLVRDATGLRSGDLVRLSQDGPDLLFELNQDSPNSADSGTVGSQGPLSTEHNKTSAQNSDERENRHQEPREPLPLDTLDALAFDNDQRLQKQGSVASSTSQTNASDLISKRTTPITAGRQVPRKRRGSKLATLITLVAIPTGAIAGISIAVVLLWVIWKKDPLGIMQPAVEMQQNVANAKDTASLNKQPRPLVDEKSLEQREGIGNSLRVGSKQPSSLPNKTPITLSIEPFDRITIDLSTTPELVVDLSRNVTSSSASTVRYGITPSTQEGIAIDAESGSLTWVIPSELSGQEVEVPFFVSSGNPAMNTKNGRLYVKIVSSVPGQVSNASVLESVYLIVTQINPGDLYLPLGTACSIGENTLLTSSSVAMGLFNAQKRGWKTLAVQASDQAAIPLAFHEITDVKAHKIYVVANENPDRESRLLQQAYFDLAILTTPTAMDSSLNLRKTSETQIDMEDFTCIGYPVNGNVTSDVSKLPLLQEDVKLIARIPPSNAKVIDASPPLLLQFQGDAPSSVLGGIFLDSNSEVVGIYTFSADIPAEVKTQNVLYATEPLPAQGLLNEPDRNKDFWISASEPVATQ